MFILCVQHQALSHQVMSLTSLMTPIVSQQLQTTQLQQMYQPTVSQVSTANIE